MYPTKEYMKTNNHHAVVGFLFDFNMEQVLLIKKNRPEWAKDYYNGVGGKLEKPEIPMAAMTREFFEETSVLIKNWKFFAMVKRGNVKLHIFYKCDNTALSNIKQVTDEQLLICSVNAVLDDRVPTIYDVKDFINEICK